MNNTLLIHIGMPKTGSTALQKFLLENNYILEKYGWCCPILNNGEVSDSERLDAEACGNGYYMFEALRTFHDKVSWDTKLEIAMKYLEDKNVIISSEDAGAYMTEKFISSIKEKYENTKVLVYLRRQDRMIESFYNQKVKNGEEFRSFDQYIHSDAAPENLLDYVMKLDLISRIIGKKNLIVRIYEKQQLVGNNTITDFLSVLGIPSDQDNWKKSDSVNLSLGGNYLEINRLFNSVQSVKGFLQEQDDTWYDKMLQKDFCNVCMGLSHAVNQDKSERGFFLPGERKKFLAKFAEENEQIAREYLHREDGRLFYDDRMDYPFFNKIPDSDFEADMIRFFTAMIYIQNQRMKELMEKKTNEFVRKLLMKDVLQKRNGRQIILFGAGCNCQRLFAIIGNISCAFIADNDLSKQGMILSGIKVKYAMNIQDWKKYFVIVTCEKADEIEKQLQGFGLEKNEDYIFFRDYMF